jgi:hypothetical protein
MSEVKKDNGEAAIRREIKAAEARDAARGKK